MNKLKTTVSVLCLAGLVSSFAMADFSDSFKKTETASNGFYVQGNVGLDVADFKLFFNDKDALDKNTANIKGLKNNKLPMFGVGVGYKFNDFFRADISAQYRTKKVTLSNKNSAPNGPKVSGDIDSVALFANGYVDLSNSTIFTPYLTAGLGTMTIRNEVPMSNITVESDATGISITTKTSKAHTSTSFAWNAGLGTRIQLTDKVDADVGYRYVASAKAKKELGAAEYKAHEILAGIAYHF